MFTAQQKQMLQDRTFAYSIFIYVYLLLSVTSLGAMHGESRVTFLLLLRVGGIIRDVKSHFFAALESSFPGFVMLLDWKEKANHANHHQRETDGCLTPFTPAY